MMNNDKFPSEIYVIVEKCEQLPDLRSEKEKAKNIKPKWQVVFQGVKEERATQFCEGITTVNWMCECFLRPTNGNVIGFLVQDDKSRTAGKVIVDLMNAPIADKNLLKPGEESIGARETYRNLQQNQSSILDSPHSCKAVLSFWVWVLEFSDVKKERSHSNLERLKHLSKSAVLKVASYSLPDAIKEKITVGNRSQEVTNILPKKNSTTDNSGFIEFEFKFGESTFANIENGKFDKNIWLGRASSLEKLNPFIQDMKKKNPDEMNPFMHDIQKKNSDQMNPFHQKEQVDVTDYTNPFFQVRRSMSMSQINEIKKNPVVKKPTITEHRMSLVQQRDSMAISNAELDVFLLLADYYSAATKDAPKNAKTSFIHEEFFTVLNKVQRRHAWQVNRIKALENENKLIAADLGDVTNRMYKIKQRVIMKNMFDLLSDL